MYTYTYIHIHIYKHECTRNSRVHQHHCNSDQDGESYQICGNTL